MEQVLYADILFFINFSMDFVTLYITSRLTSSPFSGVRGSVAAALGGLFATAVTAVGMDGIIAVAGTGAVSLLMVSVTFGKSTPSILIRRAAVFWGSGALLGGIMTVICSFGDGGEAPDTGAGTASLLFLGCGLCLGIIKSFTHLKRRQEASVLVKFSGREARFSALVDSGNLLTDPLTSKPVILADAAVLGQVSHVTSKDLSSGKIPPELSGRIRMIPVRGIGDSSLLTGFVPDTVKIITQKGEKTVDAVIAVTELGADHFGGYGANVPAVLL